MSSEPMRKSKVTDHQISILRRLTTPGNFLGCALREPAEPRTVWASFVMSTDGHEVTNRDTVNPRTALSLINKGLLTVVAITDDKMEYYFQVSGEGWVQLKNYYGISASGESGS